MDRDFYLSLARRGLAMPIGTDMVLREKPDHEERMLDGRGLGEVVVEAARRYETPLAVALMDLRVEKAEMLWVLGIETEDVDGFHFTPGTLPERAAARMKDRINTAPDTRMRANLGALSHAAEQPGLAAVGMCIGPFSLATKLMADPITAAYLLGSGTPPEEDPEAGLLVSLLELSNQIIFRSIEQQFLAGAKAIVVCEPAANKAYISPIQMSEGSDVFERLVMAPNRRVARRMEEVGVDLIFHDCGELSGSMLQSIASLRPKMLSLGASRKLWEDAPFVDRDVVLFGNLPTKKFYSDSEMPLVEVERRTHELVTNMIAAGHPFVLGSECDVLSVPEHHERIGGKVRRMLEVSRELRG
jgi:uroporphyrinogen-III decarboxylase